MFYPVIVIIYVKKLRLTDSIFLSDEKFKLSFFRIQSIETNNGKTLAKTDNCCGKLSVKLNNGEELLGND